MAADHLTKLALQQATTTAGRAEHLYRLLLGRDPTPLEKETISRFVDDRQIDADDAVGALDGPEGRRWFQVTQALLAQDELVVPL